MTLARFRSEPVRQQRDALTTAARAAKISGDAARFVSKWDEAALQDVPAASRVDPTDRLAREFHPDAHRQKTIDQLKASPPLPLDEATRLAQGGKL